MPIYEYICRGCQNGFECFFLNRQDSQDVVCSRCGGRRVQRVFSTFGVAGGRGSGESSSNSCSTCLTKNCSTCR
ncbi:hypothetical protein KAX22_07615 [bacterium]|nr:hypothetical protein [bacterium]